MNDITIIYYTANRISAHFAQYVQKNIEEAAEGAPIISVSHKPVDFGHNIVIPNLEPSTYNIYKQILIGAMAANTPYIGCAEDDSLYLREHYVFRPPLDTFAYNNNRWQVNRRVYFLRRRASMCMCIAPTELLVKTLCEKFAKFPHHLSREECAGWGEPGRKEHKLGLPKPKLMVFQTDIPTLTFNHRDSVGGARKVLESDEIETDLPHWGSVTSLWEEAHG